MLEEMELEFGISCPPGLPKDQYQEDILDLEKSQEELERAHSTISQMEEEKNKVHRFCLIKSLKRNIKCQKQWPTNSRSVSM